MRIGKIYQSLPTNTTNYQNLETAISFKNPLTNSTLCAIIHIENK